MWALALESRVAEREDSHDIDYMLKLAKDDPDLGKLREIYKKSYREGTPEATKLIEEWKANLARIMAIQHLPTDVVSQKSKTLVSKTEVPTDFEEYKRGKRVYEEICADAQLHRVHTSAIDTPAVDNDLIAQHKPSPRHFSRMKKLRARLEKSPGHVVFDYIKNLFR